MAPPGSRSSGLTAEPSGAGSTGEVLKRVV
jgi:hypothetical protein